MRIAICIPVHGETKAVFTKSLARMLVYTMKTPVRYNGKPTQPEIEIFTMTSSILTFSRQSLMLDAIRWNAHYLLWADADHSFPPDALLRLLLHSKPVVGANYVGRGLPEPTAANVVDGARAPVPTTRAIAEARPLEKVDTLGLGLCLVNMGALQAVKDLKDEGVGIGAMFQSGIVERGDHIGSYGEDAFFFDLLARAGVPVYVDHLLSMEVGHIAEIERRFTE